jgi:DNA (cytosine-5)-methyltransferase 1
MGYRRAGFEVVGVDLEHKPDYPFEFHRGDALEFLAEHGHEFDAVHASPPCHDHTKLTN